MNEYKKEELLQKVVEWAKDRGIDKCTTLSQRVKRGEELLELENAIIRLDNAKNIDDSDCKTIDQVMVKVQMEEESAKLEIIDAIGDVFVCIINENLILMGEEYATELMNYRSNYTKGGNLHQILSNESQIATEILNCTAKHFGLDLWECLEYSYNIIKERKGLLIGGTFVKEKNLKQEHYEEFKNKYGHEPRKEVING